MLTRVCYIHQYSNFGKQTQKKNNFVYHLKIKFSCSNVPTPPDFEKVSVFPNSATNLILCGFAIPADMSCTEHHCK